MCRLGRVATDGVVSPEQPGEMENVAKWPDMTYPVRANVTLVGELLTSDSRFDDKADPLRYGSAEHAVLKRVSAK